MGNLDVGGGISGTQRQLLKSCRKSGSANLARVGIELWALIVHLVGPIIENVIQPTNGFLHMNSPTSQSIARGIKLFEEAFTKVSGVKGKSGLRGLHLATLLVVLMLFIAFIDVAIAV